LHMKSVARKVRMMGTWRNVRTDATRKIIVVVKNPKKISFVADSILERVIFGLDGVEWRVWVG